MDGIKTFKRKGGLIKLIFVMLLSYEAQAALPEINVKIGSKVKHLKISSRHAFEFHFLKNGGDHKSQQKVLEFDCDFKVANNQRSVLFASLKSKNEGDHLIFNNKNFGDHLKLATSSSKGCDIIQSVPMNKYLSSLLSKEMNGSWPIEALKAQAVAARSYAIDKMKESTESNFHIISGEIHQVSGSHEDITKKTAKAVRLTRGEVLVNQTKKVVPGFYHAECGGKILEPIDVWSGHMFDYVGRDCPYCHHKSKKKTWSKKVSWKLMKKFIKEYFAMDIGDEKKVKIIDSEKIHLKLNGKNFIFLPADFRKRLLSLGIKSNNFEITGFKDDAFTIVGKGRGHGVGMCQLGALKMAELGYNYKEILSFYYPKLEIKKVY